MLKLIAVLLNIFIILLIFVRIPEDNVGLASFADKSDLLGSPSSARRILNNITIFSIILFFGIAIKLNSTMN